MSVRTFTRRFRDETGMSPASGSPGSGSSRPGTCWRRPTSPVDEVARRAGFGTAVSLRQHLHAAVGVAPLAYRHTFRRP